ncbi:MAG TPA: c-type cytochrome [Bryobacteraceae bacterium]
MKLSIRPGTILVTTILVSTAVLLPSKAQRSKSSSVERGRYIVESVAMCEQCHTQRDEHGNPDRPHWLMGGSMTILPTYAAPVWATREPRLAGAPPGTDEEIIRLLTTGISRTGRPPDPPMPPFRMTREDAEAVLAYLRSL